MLKKNINRPITNSENKKYSVWNNYRSFDVMRVPGRRHHWTRRHLIKTVKRLFGASYYFRWLDIGIIGMVDYENFTKNFSFDYTGVDIGEDVLKDSARYLVEDNHKLCHADINDDIQEIKAKLRQIDKGEFDLITMRHVLNHCPYYEKPIFNAYHLLAENGCLIINLHLSLLDAGEELDHHYGWKAEGLVIGNRYNKLKFTQYLSKFFEIEEFFTFDDGKKPNNVFLCRKLDTPSVDSFSIDVLQKEKIIKDRLSKKLIRKLFSKFHTGK